MLLLFCSIADLCLRFDGLCWGLRFAARAYEAISVILSKIYVVILRPCFCFWSLEIECLYSIFSIIAKLIVLLSWLRSRLRPPATLRAYIELRVIFPLPSAAVPSGFLKLSLVIVLTPFKLFFERSFLSSSDSLFWVFGFSNELPATEDLCILKYAWLPKSFLAELEFSWSSFCLFEILFNSWFILLRSSVRSCSFVVVAYNDLILVSLRFSLFCVLAAGLLVL